VSQKESAESNGGGRVKKRSKLSTRASREKITPAASPIKIKPKAKPRGKSFEPGNGFGSEHRFKPGQSGNPNGRSSAAQKASALISKALMDRLPQVGTRRLLRRGRRTFTQKLADTWIESGLAGNVGAISGIAERLEGRPAVSISMDGNENPISILIASMNDRSDAIGLAEGRQRQLTEGGEDDGPNEETAVG
jgi:Family of unknown function (DUF5681)